MSYSVGICEVPGISEPTTEVVVCASSCDVIHHKSSRCSSVVTPGHSSAGGRERGREKERERYAILHKH